MVGALMAQGAVGEHEFAATMVDLIRRGVLTAERVASTKSTWMGLRTEDISDLEIGLGDVSQPVTEYERHVRTILTRVLEDGPQPLTEFRKRIREDAAANASTYE